MNLWQICTETQCGYMNFSKLLSQKKTWCIFNVDKVANYLANAFRYNTMIPNPSICTGWKQWSAQGWSLANTERGLFRNDAMVRQLLAAHIYYMCVHIYVHMYVCTSHISPCTCKEKEEHHSMPWCWQVWDSSSWIPWLVSLHGRVSENSFKRGSGGRKKKRHLKKTKARIEHVLEEQCKCFTRAKKWFTES